MNEKVKTYLNRLPSPQKEICKQVRNIIVKTFPNITESFKNGVPWYEGKYYIVGLKDHVNIGFSVLGLTPDEMSLFEGKGRFMRHIKIHSPDEVDEEKIAALLKAVKEMM